MLSRVRIRGVSRRIAAAPSLRDHGVVLDDSEIIAVYGAGATAREIADRYDVTTNTVLELCAVEAAMGKCWRRA